MHDLNNGNSKFLNEMELKDVSWMQKQLIFLLSLWAVHICMYKYLALSGELPLSYHIHLQDLGAKAPFASSIINQV
jgi:hypothetical protein